MCAYSSDGTPLYASDSLLGFFGFTLQDFRSDDFHTRAFHPNDLERVQNLRKEAMGRGEGWEVEARMRRKDGQYRWFLIRGKPLRGENGVILRWFSSGTDIDDRKQAQLELQQLADAVPQHIVVLSGDGKRLYGNQAACEYHGLSPEQFLVEPITNCFHSDDIENYSRMRNSGIAKEAPWEAEARLRRKDGAYRWFLIRGKPLRNEQGLPVRWYLTRTDIEERKVAELELRRLIDAVPQYIRVDDQGGKVLYANDRLLDYFGMTLEEVQAGDFRTRVCHPNDLDRVRLAREDAFSRGVGWEVEARIRRKDGEYRWFLNRYNPLRDEQGKIVRWYAAGTDIEDRKQAEEALRRSEDRLRLLLEFTNKLATKLELRDLLRAVAASLRKVIPCDAIAVFLPRSDGDSLRSFVVDFPKSKGFLREELQISAERRPMSLEYPLAAMVFRTGKEWVGNDQDLLQLGLKNSLGLAEGLKTGCVLPIRCYDGVLGVLCVGRLDAKPFDPYEVDLLRQVADQVAIAIVNALAVEDRKQAENALRRSEAYLAEAQRLSHVGSWAWDIDKQEITHWSPEAYRAFGFDPSGGPVPWLEARSRIHPQDLSVFDEHKERVIRERAELECDFRLVLPDGSVKYAHCVSRPVLNASGEVIELVGSILDVTEQRQAKTALEAAFEEIKRLKDELYRENLVLKEEIDQASMFEEIVGTSDALRRVLVQVAKVAPADSTVLLIGETGTGKELVARAIHKRSQRAPKTFVSVNCAAIPAGLIASELFGHEKGAFTGATQRHLGRFELADGGTLFLDEVGDLPSETQVALLRVLQERRLERVGGTQSISVDVRIIAATNRDLKAAVNSGAFRNDLFYRLNVFPIVIPALRDRKDDLPLLVEYLTERYASKAGKKIKKIQKRTLELFQDYDWPGNIRELQNIIERAVILCDGEILSVDESWLQSESMPRTEAGRLARLGPEQEKKLIEAALAESQGRIGGPSGAAAKLGIPRSTLESKIRKLGIPKYRFKSA
jgi:PAS domain S-box-containing protein